MTGGVQDMRNVRQDRGSAWRMYNRRGAGHEECTAGWNWMQDMRIYERRLSENWAFMKRGKQDLFTLDTFIEENSWFICRCQRFDFFFVDLDNKQFVSFHKKKKIHFFCERLYCSFDHTLHSFERFRFVSILNNFEIIDLFAWFNASLRKINASFLFYFY